MMNALLYSCLDFGSELQLNSIELRRKVLRIPLGLDFTQEELDQEKDQVHIGAHDGNNIMAILLFVVDANNQKVKMRQVAVDPTCQGAGVGKQLVEFSEQWCMDNGIKKIELHARASVLPFYEKMNYEVVGDSFMEVGIPHFKMFKEL